MVGGVALYSVSKSTCNGVAFIVLTIIVFLSPTLIQVTGNSYLKMIGDLAYLLMFLFSVYLLFQRHDISIMVSKKVFTLIVSAIVFVLIGIYYNGISMIILQFREFKYLLLLVIVLPYNKVEYFRNIWITLKIIAAMCIPISIIQWYIYKDNGDFDFVSGLLGEKQSATLTMFVLIIFFTEMGIRLINNKNIIGAYFFYLIPTALNETKITLVLFPVMLISTLFLTKKFKLKVIIPIILLAALFLSYWVNTYTSAAGKSFVSVFTKEYIQDYLFATNWSNDVGRFAKIAYGFKLINNNAFFGYGLGASYYGETSGMKGYIWDKFYINNPLMFSGTRIQLFDIIIDSGLIGTVIVSLILAILFIKLTRSKTLNLEKLIAVNSIIVVIFGFVYIQIFHTYQIMYILVLYTFIYLRFYSAKSNTE